MDNRPFEPDELVKFIQDKAAEYILVDYNVTPGLIGAMVGHIEKAIRDTIPEATKEEVADMRRKIFGFLFGSLPCSSKDLTDDEIYALREWVDSTEMFGAWLPQEHFSDEIRFLIWRLI